MKRWFTITSFVVFFMFTSSFIFSQSTNFDVNNYKAFLNSNQNLTTEEMQSMYDIGKFKKHINSFNPKALYLDSVKSKFQLTDDEKQLLEQNGFVVTERINSHDYISMFLDIYKKDLPVFISTDAILNAFHKSYDIILKGVELRYLIPKLKEQIELINAQFPNLENKYSSNTELNTMLKDVDLYLSVAGKLLNINSQPYYSDNIPELNRILQNIESLKMVEEPMFSTSSRKYDYSQFKVRGHYTDSSFPELADYFKSMIWLGRTELYLIFPVSEDSPDKSKSMEDVQRQIIDTYLLMELIELANVKSSYDEFEKVISSFVGEQDNVTVPQVLSVFQSVNISDAAQLLDTNTVKIFQDTLTTKPFAEQKILSQVIMSDPFKPEYVKPASAFLIYGQRFVVDSYVTGNVIYDKIINNGAKVIRLSPSTLDVLFALGNSAAAQLLTDELNAYKYSSNLSALRYLIDSYGDDFWQFSIYNMWLKTIKSLNPPLERETLPQFMQTAAWWQQKMNTQLASWAELRHDNILYAKQSYTPGIVCSYPYGYVEPIPDFYRSFKILSEKVIEKFSNLSVTLEREINYFNSFKAYMDTLESIAVKELANTEFSEKEKNFLKKVIYESGMGCGVTIDGWYTKLIFNDFELGDSDEFDQIIADYHTIPYDEFGGLVGWVKHAGTGHRNLCILTAEIPGTGSVAFAGPVSSYYEFTSTNFLRLTDDEWKDSYLIKAARPDWVNIFLADSKGNSRGDGARLFTDIKIDDNRQVDIPQDYIITQNYPNPFNPETIISFTIPSKLTSAHTEINIYNIQGELVKRLFEGNVKAGTYLTKWDGKNAAGQNVSSGIYIYEVKANELRASGKMNLLK